MSMNKNMKILLFGATGKTGTEILFQAIKRGISITAFVRNPLKIADEKNTKITVIKGDILDYSSVYRAVKGHTAVISALGIRTIKKIQ